ncbi:MAG: hypothetical protein GQ527_05725 [Bacteroidales bacterium]|nr:hypothetical protein [Bacteroidales bacterium]
MIIIRTKSKTILSSLFSLILVISINYTSYAQSKLDNYSSHAFHKIKQSQKNNGEWLTLYNFDTIPTKFREDKNPWLNFIIIDLLKPISSEYNFETIIPKSQKYISYSFNKSNGLLKFHNDSRVPEDSDDTALFWISHPDADTNLIPLAISTIKDFKSKNGLYHIWLDTNGIIKHPQVGRNPSPTDILSNIHVLLLFKQYAPKLVSDLCASLKRNINQVEYWTYNERSPWLYYIRELDLVKNGCLLNTNIPREIKNLNSQETYTKMSKLIRDLALKHGGEKTRNKAQKILLEVANNDFEYIKITPLLMYHNDLTAKNPAYFWSYDIPYALWLRLYYEYSKTN